MGGERKGRGVGVFPGLHCEQDEECHHQTEETHSLRQSKAQDGVGEELLLKGGVPVAGGQKGTPSQSTSYSRLQLMQSNTTVLQ